MKRVLLIVCLSAFLMFYIFADVDFSGESSLSMAVSIPPAEDTGKITGASVSQTFELDAYGDTTAFYLNAGFVWRIVRKSPQVSLALHI